MRSSKRFLAAALVAGVALLGAACESGDTTVDDTDQLGDTGGVTDDTGGDTGDLGTGGTGTESPAP